MAQLSTAAVRELTAALWQVSQSPDGATLTSSEDVQGAIGRCDDAGRRAELASVVAGLDTLPGPDRRRFGAALDETQVESKLWLIDEMHRYCDIEGSSLLVLGAWYGILPLLIEWRLARAPERMVCVDRDNSVCADGERIVGAVHHNIEYRVADVHALDYQPGGDGHADVVINTICEHLPDIGRWWDALPPGQLVVLQSNNYFPCPDHVNCVHDVQEMKQQTPMSEVLFEGVLHLPVLDRFMLIGRR